MLPLKDEFKYYGAGITLPSFKSFKITLVLLGGNIFLCGGGSSVLCYEIKMN